MAVFEPPHIKYPEQKGLISIIIPIYNNEIYLRECLDSVLAQTLTNWEAILVDDGSTDNTGKIIDEYAEKDSRFIAIHKQNGGTLLARKTGLENSGGEFIANIDHDDTYHPQFLEKMYAKMTEINADFVWCGYETDNLSWHHVIGDYKWSVEASENISALLDPKHGIRCLTWDKLVKREIYAKVLFPDIYIVGWEDLLQMYQIAYHSKSAAFVPESLYFHRDNGSSTKNTKEHFISCIKFAIYSNDVLEMLFNGVIPCNVKNAFYCNFSSTAFVFFSLCKKERKIFEDKFKPYIPEFIRHEKKLYKKILCFLASKGIEFPLMFRNWVENHRIGRVK